MKSKISMFFISFLFLFVVAAFFVASIEVNDKSECGEGEVVKTSAGYWICAIDNSGGGGSVGGWVNGSNWVNATLSNVGLPHSKLRMFNNSLIFTSADGLDQYELQGREGKFTVQHLKGTNTLALDFDNIIFEASDLFIGSIQTNLYEAAFNQLRTDDNFSSAVDVCVVGGNCLSDIGTPPDLTDYLLNNESDTTSGKLTASQGFRGSLTNGIDAPLPPWSGSPILTNGFNVGDATGDPGVYFLRSASGTGYVTVGLNTPANQWAKFGVFNSGVYGDFNFTNNDKRFTYDSQLEEAWLGDNAQSQIIGIDGSTSSFIMAETTTPSSRTNYGQIYTKNDNKLYFQDGAGTEHEIAFV